MTLIGQVNIQMSPSASVTPLKLAQNMIRRQGQQTQTNRIENKDQKFVKKTTSSNAMQTGKRLGVQRQESTDFKLGPPKDSEGGSPFEIHQRVARTSLELLSHGKPTPALRIQYDG